MSLSLDHEQNYIHQLAKFGKEYQFTVFHFVPSNYNPLTKLVKGKQYDSKLEDWVMTEFPIPSIIYDRCFYLDDSHSIQCKNIVQWLKQREDIQFIGYGLPDKWTIYQVLHNSKLSSYIPTTYLLETADQLPLHERRPLIIKPINGSQGNGLYFIHQVKKGILVKTDKKEKKVEHLFHHIFVFRKWLNQLLKNSNYLYQDYLPLYNIDNQPFDIRSLLQKKPTNKWEIAGMGIRLGESGRIISNLSAGAEIVPFKEWFQHSNIEMKSFLLQELKDILLQLPSILEGSFPSLFELGVDIGITPTGSLWILDVNSKPGRKVPLTVHPENREKILKAPILYAQSLVDGKRRTENEEVISYRNNS